MKAGGKHRLCHVGLQPIQQRSALCWRHAVEMIGVASAEKQALGAGLGMCSNKRVNG